MLRTRTTLVVPGDGCVRSNPSRRKTDGQSTFRARLLHHQQRLRRQVLPFINVWKMPADALFFVLSIGRSASAAAESMLPRIEEIRSSFAEALQSDGNVQARLHILSFRRRHAAVPGGSDQARPCAPLYTWPCSSELLTSRSG